MNTLDEVIKAVAEDLDQAAVSYPESFYDYDTHKDALYYLKEYREHLEDDAKNATTELECAENAHCTERKKGEWIEYPDCLRYEGAYADDQIVCSACHHVFCIMDNCTEEFDFCPHCGADLRGE